MVAFAIYVPEDDKTFGVWVEARKPGEDVHVNIDKECVVIGYNAKHIHDSPGGFTDLALVFDKQGEAYVQYADADGQLANAPVTRKVLVEALIDMLETIKDASI